MHGKELCPDGIVPQAVGSASYNAANQLTQWGASALSYGLNGNPLSVTDARGNVTSYTYDSMDRLAARADPLLQAESYQHDAGGNLTQFTDRKGKVTTFAYDSLNRRTLGCVKDSTMRNPPKKMARAGLEN